MGRIFGIIAVLSAILILIAGIGTHWFSQFGSQQVKTESSEILAKGIALSISAQTKSLQIIVSKMAASPKAIAAIESNNPQLIAQAATFMENYLPGILKIRLLPANVSELDKSGNPRMGHADLVMSQETLINPQPPVIQGENGNDRHLAITAAIKKEGKAIGIILASLKFDFIQASLNEFQISHGYIELLQKQAFLASAGNNERKSDTGDKIDVPQSAWSLHFWSKDTSDVTTWSSIIGFTFIPVLLSGLVCFLCYRKFKSILNSDHESILNIVQELMSRTNIGSHPVQLSEVKMMMSSIIQYQRELDREQIGQPIELKRHDDNYLGAPMSVDVLEADIDDIFEDGSLAEELSLLEQPDNEGAAISLPSPEKVDEKAIIFRAYDIRGIVGQALSEDMVFDIGRAVGSEAKEKNIKSIVVGRDGRTSSPALSESLSKGIISTGVNVLDIGLVPTPLVYFVAHHSEGKSGIVVTGSHNPAEYNGLKITINGETYADDKIQAIKQRIDNENYSLGKEGTISKNDMFVNEYIGIIEEKIHFERTMKVVVDCGNGAAGKLAPLLLKTIGCEVVELFCDIDGTFPNHHPDPSKPENMVDLIAAVKEHKADVGIAFDGDGDRLGVVDSNGKIIWPDRLMMFFAKDLLTLKPGAEIIYDVKCSRHLGEQIMENGGRPLMQKTGHAYMKTKVKETGAALAGEMSGHIIFNNCWFGFDDALFASVRLIEILSSDTRNSAEVFSDFPDSINTPEIAIELEEGENVTVMEALIANASFTDGKIIDIDGMRVDFLDGWGLVRASNTMPNLTLRFEADSEDGLKRIQSQFKELLLKVKSDIVIPF